jgi:hypothetical protein
MGACNPHTVEQAYQETMHEKFLWRFYGNKIGTEQHNNQPEPWFYIGRDPVNCTYAH